MNVKKQIWTGILAALAMTLLILDAKTAISGAQEGIMLCIYTVLPALFPFIFLSVLISGSVKHLKISVLKPICSLCRLPRGSESFMLLGFLGGYPVGAQSIAQAYWAGNLSKLDAHRMLGFCSNAGPAFIFGMLSGLFTSAHVTWILWLIHIVSALIVGILLPGNSDYQTNVHTAQPISVPKALDQSIRVIANICGWVILFRVLIAVCSRWFLWFLPKTLQIGLIGLLELVNGSNALLGLTNQGSRFVFIACFLSFGGLCVAMQTLSVTKGLGVGLYFPGKLLQSLISLLLAGITQAFIFPQSEQIHFPPVIIICTVIFCTASTLFLHKRKKVVAFAC